MNDNEPKTTKSSVAIVGFVAGIVTVVIVFLVLKGC
jgi:hypothetical protein